MRTGVTRVRWPRQHEGQGDPPLEPAGEALSLAVPPSPPPGSARLAQSPGDARPCSEPPPMPLSSAGVEGRSAEGAGGGRGVRVGHAGSRRATGGGPAQDAARHTQPARTRAPSGWAGGWPPIQPGSPHAALSASRDESRPDPHEPVHTPSPCCITTALLLPPLPAPGSRGASAVDMRNAAFAAWLAPALG